MVSPGRKVSGGKELEHLAQAVAEGSDELPETAARLGQQLSVSVVDGGGEVLGLDDRGRIGGVGDDGLGLVHRRDEAAVHLLGQSDARGRPLLAGDTHSPAPIVTRKLPCWSTTKASESPTAQVEEVSAMRAGPRPRKPCQAIVVEHVHFRPAGAGEVQRRPSNRWLSTGDRLGGYRDVRPGHRYAPDHCLYYGPLEGRPVET